MPEYRLFEITIEGRIKGPPRTLTCDNDEKAVALARDFVQGFAIEVWDRSRLVGTVKPGDGVSPARES